MKAYGARLGAAVVALTALAGATLIEGRPTSARSASSRHAVVEPGEIASSVDSAASASAQAIRGRIVVLGDSIALRLCPYMPEAGCVAYKGGWVSTLSGDNLVDGFITTAELHPGDIVVFSGISAWHVGGIDDAEILRRLDAAWARIASEGARLILLEMPDGNFPNCQEPALSVAIDRFGRGKVTIFGYEDPTEACATQMAVGNAARTQPAEAHIQINGPYEFDLVHPTADGLEALATAVRAAIAA